MGKKHAVKNGSIPANIQQALWEQPTCANTKLIPGKLSVCVGMPIMIHNNAATEMCITKGQEAVVYSWDCHQGINGTEILDTLFVQLVDLPSPIKLDGLPQNVVPLTRTTVTTNCRLPDDTSITVSRNQVEALPNFAMMDYASIQRCRSQPVSITSKLLHCFVKKCHCSRNSDSQYHSPGKDHWWCIWSATSRVPGARVARRHNCADI